MRLRPSDDQYVTHFGPCLGFGFMMFVHYVERHGGWCIQPQYQIWTFCKHPFSTFKPGRTDINRLKFVFDFTGVRGLRHVAFKGCIALRVNPSHSYGLSTMSQKSETVFKLGLYRKQYCVYVAACN